MPSLSSLSLSSKLCDVQVHQEMMEVLNQAKKADTRHTSTSDLRHMSAQTVFSVLDYLTKWKTHLVRTLTAGLPPGRGQCVWVCVCLCVCLCVCVCVRERERDSDQGKILVNAGLPPPRGQSVWASVCVCVCITLSGRCSLFEPWLLACLLVEVQLCECMHVCVCGCVYVCVEMFLCLCVEMCFYICVCVFVRVCMFVCEYVYVFSTLFINFCYFCNLFLGSKISWTAVTNTLDPVWKSSYIVIFNSASVHPQHTVQGGEHVHGAHPTGHPGTGQLQLQGLHPCPHALWAVHLQHQAGPAGTPGLSAGRQTGWWLA